MKHLSTLVLSLGLATAVQAQITVGQNEMPHAGDQLLRTQAVLNPFINYTATGPAHTWNFANLQANGEDTARYRTVASTNFVYAIVYADLFFNPNRANTAKNGVDIAFSQLLPITNPYTFIYRTASTYETVGYGAELSGIPLPIIFDQHDVIYQLPLHFGDAGQSHSSYHLDVPVIGYYGYQQDRSNVVDGWGGITTPAGTFDVLRVHTTLTIKDSLHVDTLGTGFAINRPIIHEYKWLTQGLRVPVLQINTTEIFGFEVVSAIYYYDVPRSIDVVAPLAATICPGATLDLHYTSTGAFNAGGFFVPANHFTAQLSDANGSFANPTDLGNVTATGPGTISVTIPAGTPPGTHYRIRVVSSSPAFTGDDNGFDITIGGTTTAAITAGGATNICTGDTLTLSAVGGPSYQWQRDGSAIGGADGDTYEATEAGSYTVVVDNACGMATSSAIQVVVNERPVQDIAPLDSLICAGGSLAFNVHDGSGQTPLAYQWFLNDAPIAGATDTVWNATLAGQYTAQVTNTGTGCTFTTEGAQLEVETVPMPELLASDSTTFCQGGSVLLSVAAQPGMTYLWYHDGMIIDGATDPDLSVGATGDYTVVAIGQHGCASDASEAVSVNVVDVPSEPQIITSEPTQFCEGGGVTLIANADAGVTYQWLLNGSPIADADADQLTVTSAGSYTVTVTNAGGCGMTADPAVDVVVFPLPAMPVVSQNGDSLYTSGNGTFTWALNGNTVDGATGAVFGPSVNGMYTATVTDANGCSSTSEPYAFIGSGMADGRGTALFAVPNPTTGMLTLTVPGARGQVYELVNATGSLVRTGRLTGVNTAIDLSAEVEGLYFLRFRDTRTVLKIVVAR